MEGGVRVLLHKQVPGADLVDYDHLHSDPIREHELERGEGQRALQQSFSSTFGFSPPGPRACL